MVFTWVSTGAIEPYTPPPRLGFRVPSTHSNQKSKETNNDSSSLDTPELGGNIERAAPGIRGAVQAYQQSNAIRSRGDSLRYVYEIMSEDIDTLQETDTLDEAKRKFRTKRYRHIPIINSSDRLVGVFSDRDMLRVIADEIPLPSLIRNHMVAKILTADPDTEIREAAHVMISEKIGCLPVVNKEHHILGMITRSDILKSIARKPPLELFA
jgi:acetoin utilization protein AcuB